jgi:hypothetical protein
MTSQGGSARKPSKRTFLRSNSLSLVMFSLFVVFAIGLMFTGQREFNQEQVEHGEAEVPLDEYVRGAHFWEALSENWESEFLQMFSYVFLTIFLLQRGSAESKDPEKHESVDHDPRDADKRGSVPWPVRRGGLWLRIYENSLFLAFLSLFLVSWLLHAMSGARDFSAEQEAHGAPAVTTWDYLRTSRFWFESFQNWQSEFLVMAAIVVLTIFLRQRGSPESKPVAAPHSSTGN